MKTNARHILVFFALLTFGFQSFAQTQSPRKALIFNGINQYVSGGLNFTSPYITIEAWVYNNTLPAGVIKRYVTLSPEVAVLRYDGSAAGGVNQLHFYIKSAGVHYHLRATNVLTTGTWMHIAGTYDGEFMKLYLNGVLLQYGYANTLDDANGFTIGAYPNGTEALDGKIDEVTVWDDARSMSDIREDMYRTAPTWHGALKHYWQFNNGTGTTLTDLKGGATGTLYNMTNSNWIASTIPFSAGAVNTQIVSATGTTLFTGTGLSMNFTALSGTNTFVVSRIDTLPNQIPTGVHITEPRFWVINNYESSSFSADVTFPLNRSITTMQESHPEQVKLYSRSGNSDGTWSLMATASALNATNGTATFNGITGFIGQYMIGSDLPDNFPGTALNFDGTNDYVSCGNASSLNITGAITVEAWINADTWNANSWGGTIVGKDNTNSTGYVLRCGNNGMLSFVIGIGGAWHEALSGAVMQAGRWNCVAGVFDGTTLSVYVNGVLSGQHSVTSTIGISTQSLLIGSSPGYPTRYFDGKIDEVRIWNTARTQSQIQGDMYNTLAGAETGLVNYWQFNDGAGTTLFDIKGSSNGTLANMSAPACWVESYAMVVPAPAAASNIISTGFTANWTAPAVGSVTSYKLDVSTNNTFTAMVSGYNNLDCGTALSYAVTGLSAGTTYYYRVRADKTSVTGTGANYCTYTTVTTCIPPAISSQSTPAQSQPLNGTFTPITVTATGSGLSYQWYKNASANNSGGTSLGSANGAQTNSYTPQAAAIGTLYFYCVVSGTCGASQTSAISGAIVVNTVVAGITGTGTPGDPYQIGTLSDLQWLQSNEARPYLGFNYIQTADINAAPTRNWDSGNGFSPIGRFGSTAFTGNYNGKGHSVDSLYLNRPDYGAVGFFGSTYNSTFDSLNVTNVTAIGYQYVGGLAGNIGQNVTVRHCSSSGSVASAANNVPNQAVGGLIGYVGYSPAIIHDCYSSAEVNANGTGTIHKGGLIGFNYGNTVVTRCYARGLVTAGGAYVGGLVGQSTNADQCYWDYETTGQTSGGTQTGTGIWNLYGKSTPEMKTQSTYAGWDFTTTWYISPNANDGYPCFYYLPELSTQAVTNIKTYSATANGTIVRKGISTLLAYGICYNTTGTPTIANSKINLGPTSKSGPFTASMTGLHHGTTYYVRAFAINERDTVYGNQVSFTTTNVTQASTCLNNGDQFNYISVPDNSSLQLTNNYTIEAWIKPGVAVSTNRIIISKGYNANGYTLLSKGSGNKRGLIFDGMTTADNILTQNQWCHVAAVNDNGTRHLYLNGVEMPLTGTPVSVTANTQPLYLSNYDNGGSTNCFRGYIEEVRLWNTVMTYSQIRENMHLPLTGSEAGLVSYWQFDEGQPPTVFDKKGVNNGTWYASVFNQYTNSTIPFGTGTSHTKVVSATGTYDFTNTGLSMNVTAKSGLDSIVVAKIDTFPNMNPAGLPAVFDLQYWAVHKYGNGSLTANLTFTPAEDLTMQDQANPANIKLYTRGSAADTGWALLASATSVNAATNQVTFEGITGFSQFIIGKAVLVPVNQTVSNTTIHTGETECFNATQVITVSDFTVENGGEATLIAGGQVHFIPGIVVQPGGYMHAYITTTGDYCISPSPSIPAASGEEEETPVVVSESWFKLYPNPTRGTFTLEFRDVTRDEVQVTIYGIQGNTILHQKLFLEKSRNFSLDNAHAGIYIVRISTASETTFKKIVKL
jgi:hypothetical protein